MESEFAQSRGDDDLFADDFEPASTPTIVEDRSTEEPAHSTPQQYTQTGGEGGQSLRGRNVEPARGNSRGRGARGRGTNAQGGTRGRHGGANNGQFHNDTEHTGRNVPGARIQGSNQRGGGAAAKADFRQGNGNSAQSKGLAASRFAPQAQEAPTTSSTGANQTAQEATEKDSTMNDNSNVTANIPQTPLDPTASSFSVPETSPIKAAEPIEATPPANAPSAQPTIPTQPAITRTTAVRGDRSATGGPKVTKLTEAQLTEKMAKMAILNAQKAERFRLSEADSAAFAQKEAELQKKRAEEQKNARAMDMERAKNRERKLKAQGGREWDSEKQESDIVDRTRARGSEYVRGGHGGAMRGGLEGYAVADERDHGDDRGREYEYRERGRGRGRGGRGGGRGGKPAVPSVPTSEDFPALPGAAASKGEELKSPVVGGGDWADEVSGAVEQT